MGGTQSTDKSQSIVKPIDPLMENVLLLKSSLEQQLTVVTNNNSDITQQIAALQAKLKQSKNAPRNNPAAIKSLINDLNNLLEGTSQSPEVTQPTGVDTKPSQAELENIIKTKESLINESRIKINELTQKLEAGKTEAAVKAIQVVHLGQAAELGAARQALAESGLNPTQVSSQILRLHDSHMDILRNPIDPKTVIAQVRASPTISPKTNVYSRNITPSSGGTRRGNIRNHRGANKTRKHGK